MKFGLLTGRHCGAFIDFVIISITVEPKECKINIFKYSKHLALKLVYNLIFPNIRECGSFGAIVSQYLPKMWTHKTAKIFLYPFVAVFLDFYFLICEDASASYI